MRFGSCDPQKGAIRSEGTPRHRDHKRRISRTRVSISSNVKVLYLALRLIRDISSLWKF
ncbi:hypothetical protein D3C77_397830 [compost metagenome]